MISRLEASLVICGFCLWICNGWFSLGFWESIGMGGILEAGLGCDWAFLTAPVLNGMHDFENARFFIRPTWSWSSNSGIWFLHQSCAKLILEHRGITSQRPEYNFYATSDCLSGCLQSCLMNRNYLLLGETPCSLGKQLAPWARTLRLGRVAN